MAKSNQINSLKELQLQMPRILKTVNQNEELVLAAASNPLLALEKMGYDISPKAKTEIELHARFGKEKAIEVAQLRQEVDAVAGRKIDLDDSEEVAKLVRVLLTKPKDGKVSKGTKSIKAKNEIPLTNSVVRFLKNPITQSFKIVELDKTILDQLTKKHPLVAQIVSYKKMQITRPSFASQEVFEGILNGDISTPITGIKFRLQDREKRKNVK